MICVASGTICVAPGLSASELILVFSCVGCSLESYVLKLWTEFIELFESALPCDGSADSSEFSTSTRPNASGREEVLDNEYGVIR